MAFLATVLQRRRGTYQLLYLYRQSQHDWERQREPLVHRRRFQNKLGGVAADLPVSYGITCNSGNGVTVPYFRASAALDF